MDPTDRLTLAVGGVVMAVDVPAGWRALLAGRYQPFLVDAPAAWRVTLSHVPLVDDGDAAWIDHQGPVTHFRMMGYAGRLDLDARVAEVATPSRERAFSALERILVYVLMQTLPRDRDGLLLHAASIVRRGAGYVFVGPSGAGKTTVARLAAGHGLVLGDENAVLELRSDGARLLSTPFWGFSTPPEMVTRVAVDVPLRAVFVLAQAPDFQLERLAPGPAVLALLESEKVAVERTTSAAAWLAVAEKLIARVGVYRLGFRPTPELWTFLDQLAEP